MGIDFDSLSETIWTSFGISMQEATQALQQLIDALNELRPELDALIENPNQNEVLEKITPIGYSEIEPIFSNTDNFIKEIKQDDRKSTTYKRYIE